MVKTSALHKIEDGVFPSSFRDNSHIYYKHYLPLKKLASKKKIVHVIFQHGMIEYHRRHDDLFDALRCHFGGEVIISVMDLFGHGLSGGHRGYIDKFETFTKDYLNFLEHCNKKFYQEKSREITTVMISRSLGSLVVLRTMTNQEYKIPFRVDSFIFSNPCIKPKIALPKTVFQFLSNLPDALSLVRVPLIYNAYDLSHDKEKAISFLHDHLISKSITIQLGVETANATKKINTLSYFIQTPSLFLISGDDRVVDAEKTKLFISGMDKKFVRTLNYPKMRHDILNETCRKDVFKEIIKFIGDTRKRL